MSLTQIKCVATAGLLCLIVSGCSFTDIASPNPPGKSINQTGIPAQPSGTSSDLTKTGTEPAWLVHGPYAPLLGMSPDQVKELLGSPAKDSEQGGQRYWEYSDRGLVLVLNKEKVFIINQTQGKITESLGIGDPEEKAETFAGPLEPSSMDRGAKVGRAYPPELDIKIWVRDGRVAKAQLMRPGRDN